LRVDAAPHGFDDIVERQGEAAAQFDDESFLPGGHRGGQPMRTSGAADVVAGFPARHGAAVDAEFTGQREAVLFWM